MAVILPDVIIVDANCWGAMSMAEASAARWLVFSPFTQPAAAPVCRQES
jgi:hypothetical protein